MNLRDYFNRISELELEASMTLPVEELETYDNSNTIKFIKRQKFIQRAELNKEKYTEIFAKITTATKEKIDALQNCSLEGLFSILKSREVQYQFRNLEKFDENQLRDIIMDLYILDELMNDE